MSNYPDSLIESLKSRAIEIRKDILKMICEAGSGHPGGSLSAADILTALYFNIMKQDPKNPKSSGRDRFVLSKGHAAPVLYAALAEAGYFNKEELMHLRQINSLLQGHPEMKNIPGVEFSTGSLGQGLGAAVGMAIAGKLDKKDYTVYAMIGDGESQEGMIWEAAMAGAHYHLDNLIAFLDHNGLQIDGECAKVMNVEPVVDKWKAFNWNIIEIDGHDFTQILDAVAAAKQNKGKPTMIIANTIKGKGVSFMEDIAGWHGKAPSNEQVCTACAELEEVK